MDTDLPLELVFGGGGPGLRRDGVLTGRRDGTGTLVLWDLEADLVPAGAIDANAHALAFAAVVGREPAWCPPRRRQTDPRYGLEMLTGNGIPADAARRLLPTYLPALARGFRGLVAERPAALPSVPGSALVALRRIAARGGVRQSFLSRRIRANARLAVRACGLDPFLDQRFGVFASDYGDHRVLLANALHAIECRHRIRISLLPR